jgi:hypothetical protein
MCGGGVGCRLGCEVPFVFLEGGARVWDGSWSWEGGEGDGEDEEAVCWIFINGISIHGLYGRTEGEVNKLNKYVRETVSSG